METQQCLDFDISRGRHNPHSVKAHARIAEHKPNMRERIRVFIGGCGLHGATLMEIAKAFDKLPHQISGRLSELKRDGVIRDSGLERDDCAVYRLTVTA